MKALHTQLRERRRAMHLTQDEVARRVGLSRRAYVGIEHGAGTTVATMQAIGEVLGLRLTFSIRGTSVIAVPDDWHDGDKVTVRISKITN